MPQKPLNLKASTPTAEDPCLQPDWKILIVDDDIEVHHVTRLILAKTIFKKRGIRLLSAYSAEEAKLILNDQTDIAMILLDVVMETDDAGLKLVHYIRDELCNKAVRIILRTGQPGQAPEERVIVDYDINGYKSKNEITAQKLFTTVIASLRAYETIVALDKNRKGLEKILDSTDSLFNVTSIHQFASGVLTQLSSFLESKCKGMLCLSEDDLLQPQLSTPFPGMSVLATTGECDQCLDKNKFPHCDKTEIFDFIKLALQEHKNQYGKDFTVLYLDTGKSKGTVALLHGGCFRDENDQRLLEVFASKVSIALANAIHYQQLITAEEAATTDFLTGINNRRQLLRLGIPLLAGAVRAHTPLAVVMMDIDHFKQINDNYGHDVGDIVLQHLGKLLKQRFRATDIISRFGGEEFCIIAPQLTPDDAFDLFDQFRIHLARQPIEIQDHSLKITISIGITTKLTDSLDNMISAADKLLYLAKEQGRNRIVID